MNRFFVRPVVFCVALGLIAGAGARLPAQNAGATNQGKAGAWQVLPLAGVDYVSAKSIQEFYQFTTHEVKDHKVNFTSPEVKMSADLGSRDLWINHVRFKLQGPVKDQQGEAFFSRSDLCLLMDPVLRPDRFKGAVVFDTVVIDPGHGGTDDGEKNFHDKEKDLTLQFGLVLRSELEKRGFRVTMTRTSDVFVNLEDRVATANREPNSIFVSLHFGCDEPQSSGLRTYALMPPTDASNPAPGLQKSAESLLFAVSVHATMIRSFKNWVVDRGIQRAPDSLPKGIRQPAILLEAGVLKNGNDAQFTYRKSFPGDLAHAMGEAITGYQKFLSR